MGRNNFLYLLFLALFPILSNAAADYLYSTLPFEESDPIVEFEPPPENTVYNSKGKDAALRPDFLYSTQESHRVVLFYLPWCPHCQAYVPTYISLARRIQEMIQSQANLEKERVEFYAVSCLPNKQLCRDQHVSGVPGIKIFRSGSVEGVPVDSAKLHPFQIMRILRLPWGASGDWSAPTTDKVHDTDPRPLLKRRQMVGKKNTNNKYKKHDIFRDAYRSFHFTMENSIYTANGPLPEKSQKVLANWLLLLQNALPPAWKVQELLQELVTNFEAITKDENNLQTILTKYPPQSDEWTESCSHGKEGYGYTCGLWKLLHIVTVGVVQFNENAISVNEQAIYHTADVAQILRDFLEHFFSCNVCRTEFLKSFDSCAHNRCRRLVDVVGDRHNWIQLPLWLWQEHNSVSMRLLREQAQQKLPSSTGEDEVGQWPAHHVCASCYNATNGTAFDAESTYRYLLEEYW